MGAIKLAEAKVIDKAVVVLTVEGTMSEVPFVPVKTAEEKGRGRSLVSSAVYYEVAPHVVITDRMAGALPSDTIKNPKLNVNSTSPVLSARSYPITRSELEVDENVGVGELEVEYFDVFPTRSELAYHKYLMCGPIPLILLRSPIIIEGCPSNLKIPCNIGHVHIEKAYIYLNSPMNIMTRMMYNWIMKRKLDPSENTNRGVNNLTGRIKGMHVFVGNFTYVIEFMIVENISSITDPRLSQVVLGKPFVEISNMTHDPPEDLEREHTKSVYLKNEEDKRRGVEYVMSKILGFYKECLELGPEYATGIADEGEVTFSKKTKRKFSQKFFKENEKKIFTAAGDGVRIYPDGVVIFDKKKLGSSLEVSLDDSWRTI
ncbi:hypothetical protein Tco_0201247 [Tanacetum coccineum]